MSGHLRSLTLPCLGYLEALQQHTRKPKPPSASRHPASGYVQGMNDLVTPFLAVFLSEHLPGPMESWSADQLNEVRQGQVQRTRACVVGL